MTVTHLPQDEALCTIASMLEVHVRKIERCDRRDAPLILQLDGPGHSKMLEHLKCRLGQPDEEPKLPAADPERPQRADMIKALTATPEQRVGEKPWTVVEFDAWQHQRLAPPWWWLVDMIDQQICEDRKPTRWRPGAQEGGYPWRARVPWWKSRLRDRRWHAVQFAKELRIVIPLVIVTLVLWTLGIAGMDHVLKSVAAIAAGVSALMAGGIASVKIWRRGMQLSASDPQRAMLRSGDPMTTLRDRYAFLLDELKAPVVVLVDNLDRCSADYVVDMLEGLQTLLRHPRLRSREGAGQDRRRFVAFVVAADRDWLCDSFLQRYEKFAASARQPGQLFGQPFLEKIFDLELRLPTIPAAFSPYDEEVAAAIATVEDEAIADCMATADCAGDPKTNVASSERAIRTIVLKAERCAATLAGDGVRSRPLDTLRIAAAAAIRDMEHSSDLSTCPNSMQHLCKDTAESLDKLIGRLDVGAAMVPKVDTAYCVQRTTQLLGGHEILDDEDAMSRLGLWAILSTTWPLLAGHLTAHPEHIACLRDGTRPDIDNKSLRAVFAQRAARQLASPSADISLCEADVRRFTVPVDLDAQCDEDVGPEPKARFDDVASAVPTAAAG